MDSQAMYAVQMAQDGVIVGWGAPPVHKRLAPNLGDVIEVPAEVARALLAREQAILPMRELPPRAAVAKKDPASIELPPPVNAGDLQTALGEAPAQKTAQPKLPHEGQAAGVPPTGRRGAGLAGRVG